MSKLREFYASLTLKDAYYSSIALVVVALLIGVQLRLDGVESDLYSIERDVNSIEHNVNSIESCDSIDIDSIQSTV